MEFAQGQVVRLKSGGPYMTVNAVGVHTKNVEAIWFYAGNPQTYVFEPHVLELAGQIVSPATQARPLPPNPYPD